jgi:hypothetical protein
MRKKTIVYIILLSMVVHCGCRLGFIDHLYNKRQEIAYVLGLITEIPMSVCGSNYEHPKTFEVEIHTDSHSVPPLVIKAEAINLFFISAYSHPDFEKVLLYKNSSFHSADLYQSALIKEAFRPPTLLA